MKSRITVALFAILMALAMTAGADAQVDISPGVGRVSLINGEVSTERGDTGDWAAAAINAPLVTGDKISTGANSRAEVQLDYADILRLSGSSEAHIATLTQNRIQVQVAQGLVDFNVLKGGEAQVEIDTPNVAVHPLEPGVYRIEVDSQSVSHITVRKGRAQISTPQGSTELDKGKTIDVEGATNPQYQISDAAGKDSWDHWNDQRNSTIENAQNWQHDNRYYTGAADLDAYGRWQYVPGYNWCWTPYIDAGWVPYSVGRWVWEPFYGWTWVSAEPWGWAPYHYGRWFSYGGSWMWWPGPVTAFYRPIWAPAYVSFFGFGVGGFHVGFGFGRIGWLPVGPCDPYFPWYGRGYRRGFGYNQVNVTNITNITNITDIRRIRGQGMPYVPALAGRGRPVYSNYQSVLTNAHVRRAIMTVPANRFGTGAFGRSHAGAISAAEFRQASLVSGHVPIVPTRASLSASGRAANRGSMPSAAAGNQRFFTVRRPAAAPQPFREQAAGVERMIQSSRVNAGGRTAANQRINGSQNGYSRFGSNSTRSAQDRVYTAGPASVRNAAKPLDQSRSLGNRAATQNTGARNGWQRFGGTPSSRGGNPAQISRGGQPGAARESFNRSPGARREAAPSQTTTRPGWRNFSNSPGNANGGARSYSPRRTADPGVSRAPVVRGSSPRAANTSGGGWQRFSSRPSPGGTEGRGFSRPSYSDNGRKPALQLGHPIVTGRSSGYSNYRGSWSRGYTPAPARRYSAPRSSSSAHSSYSAPRGGGYSGGGYRGGNGGYHGGGGFHGGGGSHGRR